ncbi:hypothetical protein E2C01_007004 [Portunus trituberculatus]|uniref:Uncharacterized protein n=1 Tax=Portunus trituberculatus TaxID=210409 RepID=A0A5B7CZN8_PORTR|nr:hypothetical protein [Portunus trituberculatus]
MAAGSQWAAPAMLLPPARHYLKHPKVQPLSLSPLIIPVFLFHWLFSPRLFLLANMKRDKNDSQYHLRSPGGHGSAPVLAPSSDGWVSMGKLDSVCVNCLRWFLIPKQYSGSQRVFSSLAEHDSARAFVYSSSVLTQKAL